MPIARRPHVLIPAAIAILALAVFAALWLGARTELARGMAARMITERTGLPATIGALRVGFFPSPSLEIGGLAIAQPPGFGDEPLLSVARLRVELPWGSVFGGARLTSLEVSQATARLIVGTDGAANWSTLGGAVDDDTPATAVASDWFLGAFDLDGGVVNYRDASTGSSWQLAAIAANARDVEPRQSFPFELRLGGVSGTHTIHFAVQGEGRLDPDADHYEGTKLAFRGWLGGEPLPLAGAELTGRLARAAYDGGRGVATLDGGHLDFGGIPATFDGRFDLRAPALAGEVKVATEPFAPRASAVIFGHPLPATSDPTAFESLQVATTVKLADGDLVMDPFSGRLDDTNFDGRLVPGRGFVALSLDRIDLNRYLPPAAQGASRKKATLEDAFAALAELDVDAELRIDEAWLAGATMHDARVRIEPDAGRVP